MPLFYSPNPVQKALNLSAKLDKTIYKLKNDNVLLLKNTENTNYAILSGGGSGHEPSFTGFLNEGLLNCAVAGEIFTSPSVNSVYHGLEALILNEKKTKILVVVMNYTGDRIHFGAAIERVKVNYPEVEVEMFIVADDKSLPENINPRGLTGTLTFIKYAKGLMMNEDSNSNSNFKRCHS